MTHSRLERMEFRGNERYELGEPLGAGAMGVVYSAFDRELGMRVALKCLPNASPRSLLRFKNEFRALQDVQHDNLVRLGELVLAGDQLFFTMEIVEGVDIIAYCSGESLGVRAPALRPALAAPDEQTLDEPENLGSEPSFALAPRRELRRADLARTRASFAQLVRGLMALHAARKVHRDVKPSNVLVTQAGRVVLLDFGVVVDFFPGAADSELRLVGTASYMAPEQAAKLSVGPEADWYAVGAMLFEALTQRLPFEGPPDEILRRKQVEKPPQVVDVAGQVPLPLAALCDALLDKLPERRPTGIQILRVLEADLGSQPEVSPRSFATFLGRQRELDTLGQALAKAQRGEITIVHVEGQPGIGKTSLLRHFIERIRPAGDILVLSGRCSEREYVPYKAIDGVVDGLATAMARSSSPVLRDALERRRRDLTRAFPAFGRRYPAADPQPLGFEVSDPHVQRLGLFLAVRELLASLRAELMVVLALDDMHWADADSLALLSALVRPPSAPPLMLVLASRPYWHGRSLVRSWGAELLELHELASEDSEALANGLLVQSGCATEVAQRLAPQIAREAAGHPLFIDELVQQTTREGARLPEPVHFEAALCSRVDRLSPCAQLLVKLVAIARSSLSLGVLSGAAARLVVDSSQVSSDLMTLRHAHLLRFDGTLASSRVEPYHERVGAAVRARLSAEARRDLHRAVAAALEDANDQDAEELAVHWQGAGELAEASRHARLAADRAAEALAFERAARLYQMALECRPDTEARSELLEKLGDALANAGLGQASSRSYREAALGAGELRRFDLECKAVDQLLRTGHVDEAEPLIQRVLEHAGMSVPRTAFFSLVVLLLARLRLTFARFDAVLKPPVTRDERSLAQLNACWSVAVGLSMVDNIRGACLQSRHLLLALEVGEPLPLLKAVAAEACYVAVTGHGARKRAERLLARAEQMAEEIRDPYASGFTTLSKAICSFLMGEWRETQRLALVAERVFEARPAGAMWELASARTFGLWSSFYMGDLLTMRARVPAFIQEAETRGDRYAATLHRTGLVVVSWLASDQPHVARRQVLEAQTGWSRVSFDFQYYLNTLGNCLIDLYEGAPELAYRRITDVWSALSRSLYLRIQNVRVEAWYLRGVSAITAATNAVNPERLLRDAESCAKKIQRERLGWAMTLSSILQGGIAEVRGELSLACAHWARAEAQGHQHGMQLFAAAARFRGAAAVGGEAGARLAHEIRAALSGQGISEPDRLCALLAPGAFSLRA